MVCPISLLQQRSNNVNVDWFCHQHNLLALTSAALPLVANSYFKTVRARFWCFSSRCDPTSGGGCMLPVCSSIAALCIGWSLLHCLSRQVLRSGFWKVSQVLRRLNELSSLPLHNAGALSSLLSCFLCYCETRVA